VEARRRIDRVRYAVEVPGVEAEEALPQSFRLRQGDHPADDLDVKLCPRCGGEYQLRVETCIDCGVALVRPWDLERARQQEAARIAIVPSVPADDPGACPACGERLRGEEPECPGCGLILAQPDACPNCGAELEPHVPSCRRCGAELF
jgi:predicted amidophosphoribosyltransferase